MTHLGRWVFCVGKYQSRVDEERGRGGGGRSTSHRPAAVRPPPTNESPRPHLSERGHTKTQRETESCHNEPRAADRNEHHMIPNHTRVGGGGRPRSVTTANVWATSNLLRTQSMQPVVTHGFLETEETSCPPTRVGPVSVNCSDEGVPLTGRSAHRYRPPSLRLAASFVNNQCRGGRKRSRGGGGG